MSPVEFHTVESPSDADVAAVAALTPWNPTYTVGFVRAREMLGDRALTLEVRRGGRLVAACPAFRRSGRLTRSLRIVSAPAIPDTTIRHAFREGLHAYCASERIDRVTVGSYGAEAPFDAGLSGRCRRRDRIEFVLRPPLTTARNRLSRSHAWNLRRALRAGLALRRTTRIESCLTLSDLHAASMRRRIEHGLPTCAPVRRTALEPFLLTGAGVMYEARDGARTLSSMLVLLAADGAYFRTTGTSPEGMHEGASHFLYCAVADDLFRRGLGRCSIGGAGESNPGLLRYKRGFGPEEIRLATVAYDRSTVAGRALRGAVRALTRS